MVEGLEDGAGGGSLSSSGRRRYSCREAALFVTMVTVECANVGNSILFKAASDKGMSYVVFVVYSFGISTLALFPLAFLFNRKVQLPPFSFSLLGRICLIAVLAFTAQMLGYKGIEYSSPTLSSAISNLTPAFTFVLAIIFRMEKLIFKSLHSQAKVIGTAISISGALVVVLYEGPAVFRNSSRSISLRQTLSSPQSNWAMGGLFLAVYYLVGSIWYIVQAQTIRIYPAEFIVVLLYSMFATLISAPLCFFFLEPDVKAWKITNEIMLVSLLYSAIIGSAFVAVVQTWSLRVKGPLYVASFRPLSIAIAASLGVIFLGDTLFLGSVIGAVLIAMGFYVVLWVKAQEESEGLIGGDGEESPAPEEAPLLR